MTSTQRIGTAAVVALVALASAGCAQTGRSEAPPAQASAPAKPAVTSGMNDRGEVVDSSKVAAGSGQKVKGINNWEGEITGKPARNSKFTKLQIGMSMKQATDIAGQPTDSGAYVTGKAWIPFYFGSDRHRYEMVYKNQGRLIFAGGSLGDYTGGNLIWIIHNGNEPGYR
jgi:predicted small lipoprotein YifL